MDPSLALAKRGVLCYFRDRQSVFFSLMGVLIVVMLYLLFLKNMLVSSWPDYPGIGELIDAWVLSGILGIVPVTTCAGALQIMVEDRSNGRDKDIAVTPMPAYKVAMGYVLSTFAVGTVMSYITLVICVAYLAATGCPMSLTGILMSALLVLPSSLSASIIMYAITSFIRSTGAFSGLYTVVSVLIGFLAGIYMPMGVMPDAMKVIGTFVPASQMAAMFRDSLAADALNDVFAGAPADVVSSFRVDMGFDLCLGDFMFSDVTMIGYVILATAVFFAIAVMRIRR
ncbi:MAG: ABC transporter permease [Candidatus Methanomethylophilaceae archaeon]